MRWMQQSASSVSSPPAAGTSVVWARRADRGLHIVAGPPGVGGGSMFEPAAWVAHRPVRDRRVFVHNCLFGRQAACPIHIVPSRHVPIHG